MILLQNDINCYLKPYFVCLENKTVRISSKIKKNYRATLVCCYHIFLWECIFKMSTEILLTSS